MSRFLANENLPALAIASARGAGHDVTSISEIAQGSSDDAVLSLAMAEGRVLLTFDKDFGDLAFRSGKKAVCGIVLLGPHLQSPDYLARFPLAVLSQEMDWEGNYSVAQEGRLRVVALPS